MTRHRFRAGALALFMTAALLAGCSKDSPVEPISSEQLYFRYVIEGNDPETRDLFSSEIEALDESVELKLQGAVFMKDAATKGAIHPYSFGRSIHRVRRSIISPTTLYGDSIAIVHTQIVVSGEFMIKATGPAGPAVVRKPFVETLRRDVRFERVFVDDDDWDDDDEKGHKDKPKHLFEWKLVAASIVNGGTMAPTPVIESVMLVTKSDTFRVTNPDEYFMATKHPWKIKMPKLKGEPILLRVNLASSSPDTEVVTMHHLVTDEGLRKHRLSLVAESQNAGQYTRTYELTWFAKSKMHKKFGHLVVSALTHASVFDDDPLLYSSTIWGIPYLPSE